MDADRPDDETTIVEEEKRIGQSEGGAGGGATEMARQGQTPGRRSCCGLTDRCWNAVLGPIGGTILSTIVRHLRPE